MAKSDHNNNKKRDTQLLVAIESGNLNKRARTTKAIELIKTSLDEDILAASQEILKQDIAANSVIQRVLAGLVLKDINEFIESGGTKEPSERLLKRYRSFQDLNRRAILALSQLAPKNSDPVGNAKAVLEADE